MIEGRELHNLLSEILGYKLLVRKNTYYVVKMYPIFYIDDMYNLRDYLDKENLGVYGYEKVENEQGEHYEIEVAEKKKKKILDFRGRICYNVYRNKR